MLRRREGASQLRKIVTTETHKLNDPFLSRRFENQKGI